MTEKERIRINLAAGTTQVISVGGTPPLMSHPGKDDMQAFSTEERAVYARKQEVFRGLEALAAGGIFATETSVPGGSPGERMLAFDWLLVDFRLGKQAHTVNEELKSRLDESAPVSQQQDYVRVISQDGAKFKEMPLLDFAKNQRKWADREGMKAVQELAKAGSALEPCDPKADVERLAAQAAVVQRSGELFAMEYLDQTQLEWRIAGVDKPNRMVSIYRQVFERREDSKVDLADFAILQHRWLGAQNMAAVLKIAQQGEHELRMAPDEKTKPPVTPKPPA